MERKIGFIGCGNMGAALIRGIVGSKLVPAPDIHVFDVDRAKLAALQEETGIQVAKGNREVVENSDIIILAIKPNLLSTVLEPVKDAFGENKVLVSILAGIPIKSFKNIIGENARIIRTMPNTPALIGEGMTLLSSGDTVSEQETADVRSLFECVGKTEMLDEKLMNEVIALTSSSPAYVFMFIEAMADAAVLSGIPRALAYRLAAQAVQGSAKMVLETGKHPGELKDQVCSPGGTTIEAVYTLEKNGFRHGVMEAMNDCTRKAREMGRLFG